MVKGGIANFKVNYHTFTQGMDVVLSKVDRGTKKALVAACEEILTESLKQVPRETNTLAKSAYYNLNGASKTGFVAKIGYGGNGNPVNPISGEVASKYMIVVHEDLSAKHDQGKAKYLEDPVRQYQKVYGSRYAKFIRDEIGT